MSDDPEPDEFPKKEPKPTALEEALIKLLYDFKKGQGEQTSLIVRLLHKVLGVIERTYTEIRRSHEGHKPRREKEHTPPGVIERTYTEIRRSHGGHKPRRENEHTPPGVIKRTYTEGRRLYGGHKPRRKKEHTPPGVIKRTYTEGRRLHGGHQPRRENAQTPAGVIKRTYTEGRRLHGGHQPRRENAQTPPEDEKDTSTVPPEFTINNSNYVMVDKANVVDSSKKVMKNTYNITAPLTVKIKLSVAGVADKKEIETRVLQAIKEEDNQAVCEERKQLEEFVQSNCGANFKGAHEGSIVLVFLTDNIAFFCNGFSQHEDKIKRLIEKWVSELLRGTQYSNTTYRIDIKLESDRLERPKDNSRKSTSFDSNKDNQTDDDSNGDDGGSDDDDDDKNNGAISTKGEIVVPSLSKPPTCTLPSEETPGEAIDEHILQENVVNAEASEQKQYQSPRAKGVGSQRGECKGCNKCSAFEGYLKCEYCSCAATQQEDLKDPSPDTGSSASNTGTSQRAKGVDSRGIQRGKCKGCNKCSAFEGYLKCEYCSCAATQHDDLKDPSPDTDSSASNTGTSQRAKGVDSRGIQRGECKGCNKCSAFEGYLKCEYCSCAATQHEDLKDPSPDTGSSASNTGTSQRGVNSWGIQRGECKGCNKCSAFEGYLKCEHCSCAATQQEDLKDPSPDLAYMQQLMEKHLKATEQRMEKHSKATEQRMEKHSKATEQRMEKHLKATEQRIEKHLKATEQRMEKHLKAIEQRMEKHIKATEQRMEKHLKATEQRIEKHLKATEQRMEKHLKERSAPSGKESSLQDLISGNKKSSLQDLISGYKKSSLQDLISGNTKSSLQDLISGNTKSNLQDLISGNTTIIQEIYEALFDRFYNRKSRRKYNIEVGLQYSDGNIDEGTTTELELRINNTIQNKRREIAANVYALLGAKLEHITFKNGRIIISISVQEEFVTQRQTQIENYVMQLVQDVFPFEFSNAPNQRDICLDIRMDDVFANVITLAVPPSTSQKTIN